MGAFFEKVWGVIVGIVSNLTDPDQWQPILREPGVYWAALVAIALIVFAETGLLVGFFLPGDSLLATLGIVAHAAGWDGGQVATLIVILCAAAILGDSVGYSFGLKAGAKLYQRPDSRFFKKHHLEIARAFYQKHGGKTIIYARFVPIVRTFAPIVAGAAQMPYRRFVVFNVVGGISWIVSMVMLGFTMHLWLEPAITFLLKQIGWQKPFKVERNIDLIALVIIAISVAPMAFKWLQHRWHVRKRASVPVAAP